jgi:hypothetical protein
MPGARQSGTMSYVGREMLYACLLPVGSVLWLNTSDVVVRARATVAGGGLAGTVWAGTGLAGAAAVRAAPAGA